MEHDINTVNKMIMGKNYLYKNMIIRGLRSHLHILQLMKMGKYKRAYNLLFTNYLVPGGEGASQIAYKFGLAKLITTYPQLAPVPRYLEIEVTTVCDKKCIFCEHTFWEKGTQEIRHLKLDELKHIAGQVPYLRWVNLTGEGSAFLNKDYFKMLRYLREKYDTSLYLVDHLCDLKKSELDELIGLVDGIYWSIDAATKETYEKIKVGCSFDNALNNMKYIINKKRELKQYKPDINIRYVIVKDNLHEVPLFIDLINSIATPKDIDIGLINFTGLLFFEGIKEWYADKFPQEVLTDIKKRVNDGVFFRFEHCIESMTPPPHQCYFWMEPYIMMGGYVLSCCSVLMSNKRPFLRENSFGNLFEKDFKEIWNSERYKAFRKTITNPNAPIPILCAGCRGFNTKPRMEKYGVCESI